MNSKDLKKAINENKTKIDKVKEKLKALNNVPLSLIDSFFKQRKIPCREEEIYELMSYLYWEEEVPLIFLSQCSNINIEQLKEKIGRCAHFNCPGCERKVEIPVASIPMYKGKLTTYRSLCSHYGQPQRQHDELPVKSNELQFFCEPCAKELRKNNKKINQERQKKYEIESLESRQKLQNLKEMPYKEYLQTEHWKSTRKYALQYYKYRCSLCHANKEELHVHHKTYQHRGQEFYHIKDLIVLCKTCHEKFHDKLEANYE